MKQIKKYKNKKSGFTLIEVLVVIAIIIILAASVIIAVNPGRQFAQARNTTRWTHIAAILSAIVQNMVDNDGNWNCPGASLPATTTNIGSGTGSLNICSCIVPTYVPTIPVDPKTGSYTDCSNYNSRYLIYEDPVTKRITVSAPDAELGQNISVSR